MTSLLLACLVVLSAPLPAASISAPTAACQEEPAARSTPETPASLRRPLPTRGGVPRIEGADPSLTAARLAGSQASRRAKDEIRSLRRRWLGSRRDPEMRAEGIARLGEYTEPTALLPMHEVLREEEDDVRLAMLDHFASLGSPGQAALAFIAIRDPDAALRGEALRRLARPADPGALAMLDEALRERRHETVNRAGLVAGHLQALEAIPHLIFAQVAADEVPASGDLAWIAIGSQISYVADLVPVVGNNVGAFQPVVGTIMEGVVLQVQDAVAISYRTDVHRSLVAMTTYDFGQPTDFLGYDPARWHAWFNEVYVPHNLAKDAANRAIEQATDVANGS
ncbi:MAG: HEAT repeat domain-containing protein [Phycisphaerales bacterium]